LQRAAGNDGKINQNMLVFYPCILASLHMLKHIAKATALCGSLDLLYAAGVTVLRGKPVLGMLHSVASGPFGAGVKDMGALCGALGVLVHFSLMSVMVSAYLLASRRIAFTTRQPLISGALYGVLLFCVMYLIVLPLRWPEAFPLTDPRLIARELFPHIFFVGIPLAFMARAVQLRRVA
jgi:hypothetical protein